MDPLKRYGAWFQALTEGRIQADTPAQERFVDVFDGESVPPSTFHERLWAKYLDASRGGLKTPAGPQGRERPHAPGDRQVSEWQRERDAEQGEWRRRFATSNEDGWFYPD